MASGGEMRAFVFAVSFIIIFSGLLVTMPLDLQGLGETGENVTPLNPSLLTDFADTEGWNTTDYTPWLTIEVYEYSLATRNWITGTNGTAFDLNAKIYFLGLWLGQLDYIRFMNGPLDRSLSIDFEEIDTDAEDGVSQYSLIYPNGNSAGDLIVYYNTTAYSNSSLAWDSDALFFLHGVGLTVDTNIASLLLALLFLQIPTVPFLVNLLLVTPIWASVIFVAWFIIKEMIPFLG